MFIFLHLPKFTVKRHGNMKPLEKLRLKKYIVNEVLL